MLYPLSYGGVTQTRLVWASAQASSIRLIQVARQPNLPTRSCPVRRTVVVTSSPLHSSDKAFAFRLIKACQPGEGVVSPCAKSFSRSDGIHQRWKSKFFSR